MFFYIFKTHFSSYIYNPAVEMGVQGEFWDLVNPDLSLRWPWKIQGIHNWPKGVQTLPNWAGFGIRPFPYVQIGFQKDSLFLLSLLGSKDSTEQVGEESGVADVVVEGETSGGGGGTAVVGESSGAMAGAGTGSMGAITTGVVDESIGEGEDDAEGEPDTMGQAEKFGDDGVDMDLETSSD